jgi:hypothetical protein
VDRTPSPPVARTDKDVDDDANTSTSVPNLPVTAKDNVTSVANTNTRHQGGSGKTPVSRKTLGGPNYPSKDEMKSKGDEAGKDEVQGDNDNDDDSNDEPSGEGTYIQPLSQWRYGVDLYTVDEAILDQAINEKWHFSRFKVYNAVRGAITRKALLPMHTIFGDDIKGELL